MNILVLCTGNSARSILLESIFNTYGAGRVRAWSAGSKPTGVVHPQSLKLLGKLSHDITSARSNSWDEFASPDAPAMDLVITVCGSAADEECPIWPGAPLRAHWGVDDPAAVPPKDWENAFSVAYETLERRARALLSKEIESMSPQQLQTELKAISALA
ncbi:arsenate reductase ArsC [uncultured Roseovarius sp.]|uniref:arsenate reductase ArsC n=1 Tax=uncultured Roseovarius sp. TaxID=293344 RepID=UPI0026390888|nr:arsenate reductase ArsC [uncultured Roseovarius sp.]